MVLDEATHDASRYVTRQASISPAKAGTLPSQDTEVGA